VSGVGSIGARLKKKISEEQNRSVLFARKHMKSLRKGMERIEVIIIGGYFMRSVEGNIGQIVSMFETILKILFFYVGDVIRRLMV